MKLWQIVVVVALGIAFGLFRPDRLSHAFGHATLYVFLPALLFEAAWNLNYRAMRRHWIAIASLAGPGVVVTALIVAGALAVVRVPFGPALLTGAILSATDPIAVVAVFRRLKVPATLGTIVECESLFNDAVAVTLYRSVLAALAMAGGSIAALTLVAAAAFGEAAAGVALGVTLAVLFAAGLRRNGDARVQILATMLGAYGAYFLADIAHVSGIFATISFGIALRQYERSWITLNIAGNVNRFWDVAALVANVVVFFMVGAALQIGRVTHEPFFAAACLAGIFIGRVAISEMLRLGPYPHEWIGVVRVAGMRGALSLALALAIPAAVPYREPVIDATLAVVLVTLAAASLTIAPVVRRAVEARR